MTEVGALVGIYGAVDRAVQPDGEVRAAVSQLLPLYRAPNLHWFDEFEAWISATRAEAEATRAEAEGTPVAEGTPFPSLPEALRELAEIDPLRRMRPRRLFAIAVAMRAFPEMRDPHSELGGLVVGALRVGALAGEEGKALSLHQLLVEEGPSPGPEGTGLALNAWWNGLVATALSQGLIPDTAGMFPRPCSGRLLNMQNVAGPIAALRTEFETDEIDFDQATRFLEPENWPQCMPWFWCEMKQIGAGPPGVCLYREVVSTNCADKARGAFTAETELDFELNWLPDKAGTKGALMQYWLAPGRPQPGDVIRVDEGSLVVEKTGDRQRPLRITTTKRIQFSYPFSSQALATIMCALGYAEVASDLLCCAASGSKQGGTNFGGTPANLGNGTASAGSPGNVAAAISDCIEECATAAGDWSKRVAEGPYTADELVQDMASTWARVLRKGAAAVTPGATGAQTATRPRTRDRTEG